MSTTTLQEIIPDLVERRKLLGLSYAQLGERAGVGGSNIHQWENGRWPPRADLFIAWIGALGLELKVVTVPKKILRLAGEHVPR